MGAITRGLANNILSGGTIDATDGLTGTVSASNIDNNSVSAITSMPATVGDFVQSVASDPSPASEGDVWYNSTTGVLKSVVALAAWSAASPGITARGSIPGGGGTQTAAFVAGGYNGTTDVANTEEYNGSGWSNGGNLNTARYGLGGAGTLTAGLVFGGHENPPDNSTSTEEYDGSAWTAGGALNTGRRNPGGFGIQTAAVSAGGFVAPNAAANTEEYDVLVSSN